MVKYSEALDSTFSALGDSTRRAILARLALGETSVTRLAEPFEMSLPAVSKHLRVLERAGLLARRRDGRTHHCRLVPSPMKTAADWIAHYRQFWEEQFDALERYLNDSKTKEEKKWLPNNRKRKLRRRSGSPGPSRPRARRSFAPGPKRKR